MMSRVNWAFRVSYLYLHNNPFFFFFFRSGLISRQTQKLGIHSSSTTGSQAFQIPLLDQDSNGVLSAPQELQKPLMTLKEAVRSKEPSEKGTFFLCTARLFQSEILIASLELDHSLSATNSQVIQIYKK